MAAMAKCGIRATWVQQRWKRFSTCWPMNEKYPHPPTTRRSAPFYFCTAKCWALTCLGWMGSTARRKSAAFRFGTHLAPQLCHALAAIWHRHSHSSGAAGPPRCIHHHDLHACAEGGGRQYGQPVGFLGLWRLSGGFRIGGAMASPGRLRLSARRI